MQHLTLTLSRLFTFVLLLTLIPSSVLADASQEDKPKKKSTLPLEELYLFTEVYHQIQRHYVNEVDDHALIDLAIKGMLEGLDPHSAYLDQKEYKELKENTSGKFAGIGVEVTLEDGQIMVVSPIDNSPALKAGIKAGDVIIQVDSFKVKPNNLEEAVEKMRGPKGSKLKLTILRGEKREKHRFNLTRDIIKIQSVKSHFLETGYAYMRISQFQNTTAEDVSDQLKKIAATKNAYGLIIDLRNNPGGVLHAAIDVADLLLENGLIVYTQGREDNSREDYMGTAFQLIPYTKVIVLMNGGSASASEILAGALQDRERALIVGTQSFGKGSVQTILGLPQDKAMKITTARYYTPSGRSIQAEGITPDIYLPDADITILDDSLQTSEADLEGHLDGEGKSPKTLNADNPHLEGDYQLQHALNLLKAMHSQTKP